VTVVDSSTQQVVRQIPTEDIMKIARNIDRMQGLLFSDRA
jgi:flagellar protein FlaG